MATNRPSICDIFEWAKEHKVSQEDAEIITSLPSKSFFLYEPTYQYQGCWYVAPILAAVLSMQKLFVARDSDVLLGSAPKSGTTWMKALIFALTNRGRYVINEQHPLLQNNPHALVPFLELEAMDISGRESPRLFATHVPFVSLPESVKESNCKIVYVTRNPKDVLVSFWHLFRKMDAEILRSLSLEVMLDMFCKGETPFGPFWDSVLGYWNESLKNPDKVLFLKFEEMKQNPRIHTTRLAEFLGYPFSVEEERRGVVDDIIKLCDFEHLSNLEVNRNGKLAIGMAHSSFFRKGEVGDWKNYLTKDMAERVDRVMNDKLSGSGLEL